MNVNREKYMDFVTTKVCSVRPEHSQLNMSPEGKIRRDVMYYYDNAGKNYNEV